MLSTASANAQTDPYAGDYNAQVRQNLARADGQVLIAARHLYFAAGCKVITEGGAIYMLRDMFLPLVDEHNRSGVPALWGYDPLGAARAVGRRGLADAARPGACAYWHQHPDEVVELRRLSHYSY